MQSPKYGFSRAKLMVENHVWANRRSYCSFNTKKRVFIGPFLTLPLPNHLSLVNLSTPGGFEKRGYRGGMTFMANSFLIFTPCSTARSMSSRSYRFPRLLCNAAPLRRIYPPASPTQKLRYSLRSESLWQNTAHLRSNFCGRPVL
jgi:hypothetical protein